MKLKYLFKSRKTVITASLLFPLILALVLFLTFNKSEPTPVTARENSSVKKPTPTPKITSIVSPTASQTIIIPTQKIIVPSKYVSPTAQPTVIQNQTNQNASQDKEPPTTNFLSLQEGGQAAKYNGKVCIGFSPPRDNQTPAEEIESHYQFDNFGWSGYQRIMAEACLELPNGPHWITVQSKDKAGNEETPKTVRFTVVDQY